MSQGTTSTPKRLRRTQEEAAFQGGGSVVSGILSRLSGEVGSPLDTARTLCQALLDGSHGSLSPEQRRTIETIARQTTTTSRRVAAYIDLLRLEGGDLALNPQTFEIEDAIVSVVDTAQAEAKHKGIHLVAERSSRPLPPVVGDPIRFAQVLSSLIDNAIKFTERGQVTVLTELYDRSVAVHVVDTGGGISSDLLPHLFEDFFQPEQSKQHLGGGLGLTLSRRLVIRMGGDLWASSTKGIGSRFSFTVPRLQDAATRRMGSA